MADNNMADDKIVTADGKTLKMIRKMIGKVYVHFRSIMEMKNSAQFG